MNYGDHRHLFVYLVMIYGSEMNVMKEKIAEVGWENHMNYQMDSKKDPTLLIHI